MHRYWPRAAGSSCPATRPSRRRSAVAASRPTCTCTHAHAHIMWRGQAHAAKLRPKGAPQHSKGQQGWQCREQGTWGRGAASERWWRHSGVPYLMRRPWRRCSRARAAASPPPMSRPSRRHSAAAASRPAQRNAGPGRAASAESMVAANNARRQIGEGRHVARRVSAGGGVG